MNVKVTQTQQTDIYSIKKEVMKARVEALFEDKKCPTLDRSVEEIYAMQPQELIDLYNQINPNLQAELL
ncbi:MAG TPA: hypothetical protein VFV37_10945 [Luteibaculaceae bacterium]|nr:hypothetical protein [Luteibaculaceae bacterium]